MAPAWWAGAAASAGGRGRSSRAGRRRCSRVGGGVAGGKRAYATHLRDTEHTIAEIVTKTGITRTSLYRHLSPRPADPSPLESSSWAAAEPRGWGSRRRALNGWRP